MFGFNIRTRQNNASPGAAASPPGRGPPKAVGESGSDGSGRIVIPPYRTVSGSAAISPSNPKGQQPGSPKTELVVGEIDTSAPFRSVKAALSLFAAEKASSSATRDKLLPVVKKLSKTPEERVLEKESHLHLTLKELDKFKEKLKHAESLRQQGIQELDKANRTVQELTSKLDAVSEAKFAAIEATEDAKNRARELEETKTKQPEINAAEAWKQDVDSEREQYRATSGELNYAKQELANLRQDFDAALQAKLAAFQESSDAQHAAKVNRERLGELSKEIGMMRQTLAQVKLASTQAQETHSKVMAEKEANLQSRRFAKEQVDFKIQDLKEEYQNTDLSGNLEEKLEEATEAIGVIEEQLEDLRASDLDALSNAREELDDAKMALEQKSEEKNSIRRIVETLQLELETLRSEITESKEKESKAENLLKSMQIQVQETKTELQAALAAEAKARADSDSLHLQLREISMETENTKQEAEEIGVNTESFRQEAESARNEAKATEEKLEIAKKEVEEAKEAEKVANDQMRNTGNNDDNDKESGGGSDVGKIKLSTREFENLTRKIEEVGNTADTKVALAMAEVEAIQSKEKEMIDKLEGKLKERLELESATKAALKRAEMAEAAKEAVENELSKWRQNNGIYHSDGEASSYNSLV